YRTRLQERTELIVILTPHVIRSQADASRVMAEHASKMQLNLCEIAKIHDHGLELMTPRERPNACNDASCQKILSLPLDSSPPMPATPRRPAATPTHPARSRHRAPGPASPYRPPPTTSPPRLSP